MSPRENELKLLTVRIYYGAFVGISRISPRSIYLGVIFTSEQVGGEHHVLELRQVETIEQAVVHARKRVQPRPGVIRARQMTGMAQSVIKTLVTAEQFADSASNLGHPVAHRSRPSGTHLRRTRPKLVSLRLTAHPRCS